MENKPVGNTRNKWLVGVVAALTISSVTMLEGRRNDPYLDIVKVATVCDGETHVEMRHYSDAECDAMTKKELVKYGDGILACITVPVSVNQHAAFTLFAWNVGVPAFCKSTLVRKLNAGDYIGACNGLMAWIYAGGKPVKGLENRRRIERDICVRGST
jgi:lysozyme